MTMGSIRLEWVRQWLGPALVDDLDRQRRQTGQLRRRRKLGTVELLWLFLWLAADSGSTSLRTILEQACEDLGSGFSVSVVAFCRQRMRFPPPAVACSVGSPGR
jgi:hypothetical protein